MTDIAVLGLGESGEAAARLALNKGGTVHVSDLRTDTSTAARGAELRALGAGVELGTHDVARIAGAELVVVSPGIPPDAPVLVELRRRDVGWISEPEFAVRFYRGPLIAVTGTNGKTTTAVLIARLLEASGYRVGLGGNLGSALGPAASTLALLDPVPDWFVLEVSSFQLADVETFSPDVGVLTNLAQDHLDRYPDVERYHQDKSRLFANATERSSWVLGDQPEVQALAGEAAGRRYTFSLTRDQGVHAFVRDGVLVLRLDPDGPDETLLARADLPLLGLHNVANALAAALAARLAGAETAGLAAGLRDAGPLPHRLEPVLERGGVLWVNDSKATNVAAALSAIGSLDRPLVLLLGGKDKEEDLSQLVAGVGRGVRIAVCYGAAGPRLARALADATEVLRAESLEDAVAVARGMVRPGDALLLSPACSSFDEFTDYQERGRRFTELARGEAA